MLCTLPVTNDAPIIMYCMVPRSTYHYHAMLCVHTVFSAGSREMMNVPRVQICSTPLESLVHMMWYKVSISMETVCGSFVLLTCRDIFNAMTYDTISPLRHHEMLATCRTDMSDTSAMRRIICRFGTNGRHVVRRHCQLSILQ